MADVEKKLVRMGVLRRIIRECKEYLEDLGAEQVAFLDGMLRAPLSDGVRVMGGMPADPTFEAARIDIERFHKRIEAAKKELAAYEDELDGILRWIRAAGLSADERRYVEMRYGKGLKVWEIAARMNYSERSCNLMRARILKVLGG